MTTSPRPAAGAVARLGEHRAVAVVVDRDRKPEPLGHHGLERHVRERQVRRVDGGAGAPVERDRDAEADGRDVVVDRPRGASSTASTIVVEQRRLIEAERLPPHAVAHGEIGADDAGQQLGAARGRPR